MPKIQSLRMQEVERGREGETRGARHRDIFQRPVSRECAEEERERDGESRWSNFEDDGN